ncbi:MAG: peptide-methionine (R)-S-oxide reductase MsrB [Candidatus Binatia bacterium]
MTKRQLLIGAAAVAAGAAMSRWLRRSRPLLAAGGETFEVVKSEEEWQKLLSREEFAVLRQHATEPPGSSPLDEEHRKGTFRCAGCDLPLFSSDKKFDSGTGWPSFWEPIERAIGKSVDRSLFGVRTEVHCRRCGGHLGHVFDDGPPPTGLRYCINGVALKFKPA